MADIMEERCTIQSGNCRLEGLFTDTGSSRAVIVSHPHPLFGGNMYNPVVETLIETYRLNGIGTLRFNFRGVGNSQGRYDEGVGEQEDLRAAAVFLIDRNITTIELAGYSFGAWVNAKTDLSDLQIGEMVMVSPPVAMIDFEAIGTIECLRLVVTGNRDEIATADVIRRQIAGWNGLARLEIVAGADHFYNGALDHLAEKLNAFLA